MVKRNVSIKRSSSGYHRFRFYATIGGFSSKENCLSAAVNHRYHIRKCMRRAGFASNGFQLSLVCSLFIFGRILSTRYCTWMVCLYPGFILCTLLISFERSGKLTNKIPYQLIMLLIFYVQLANDILLIKNIISNTSRHI